MKKCLIIVACVLILVLASCSVVRADGLGLAQDENIYLTLVNKEHPIPDDWANRIELITEFDPWGEEIQIERATLESFNALRDELLSKYGIDIRLESVYRSIADQEETWAYFKDLYGEEYCAKYIAKPEYSEHHTGLAVDICLVRDGEIINDNDAMIAEKEIFSTIHQLMPEYGFILRYLEDKEDITGYSYEPWHMRYVGEVPAAEITIRHITLEEYLSTRN